MREEGAETMTFMTNWSLSTPNIQKGQLSCRVEPLNILMAATMCGFFAPFHRTQYISSSTPICLRNESIPLVLQVILYTRAQLSPPIELHRANIGHLVEVACQGSIIKERHHACASLPKPQLICLQIAQTPA
jgi:hypothetical protein